VDNNNRSAPAKPCKRTGCAVLVRDVAYCDKHKPRYDADYKRPDYSKLYHTSRWRMMRAEQLLLAPFCGECAEYNLRVRATDVDHIVPHRGDKKLFYDKSNLQSLCHSCHSKKTSEENKETRFASVRKNDK